MLSNLWLQGWCRKSLRMYPNRQDDRLARILKRRLQFATLLSNLSYRSEIKSIESPNTLLAMEIPCAGCLIGLQQQSQLQMHQP